MALTSVNMKDADPNPPEGHLGALLDPLQFMGLRLQQLHFVGTYIGSWNHCSRHPPSEADPAHCTPLHQQITDVLSDQRQQVRLWSTLLSIGAPQGCVLSPPALVLSKPTTAEAC